MNDFNPEFQDLVKPEVFTNHVESLSKEFNNNEFPYHVFPKAIQEIVEETNRCLKYPIPFTSSAMIYACSVAIGVTHKVQLLNGWNEFAVVYLAIVASPGANKSHPLSFAIKPLLDRDTKTFACYVIDRQEYDRIQNLNKNDKALEAVEEMEIPRWKKLIVSDVTQEGLISILSYNKRGVGLYMDELAAWVNNFNRYSKGSEEEFWLSNWSGKTYCKERLTSVPIFLTAPFVSVAGTIQSGVLKEFAKGNRSENGFMDRVLFVMPDNLKKEYWSEVEISSYAIENWSKIINNLLSLECQFDENNNPISTIVKFSPDAKDHFFEWQKLIADESNMSSNQSVKGILSKIETQAIRFSLILHLMKFACGAPKEFQIQIDSVKGAIELAEYFKKMAYKVTSFVKNDPLATLSTVKRNLYKALPENFMTAEGVALANVHNLPERTFKDFLKDESLFEKQKHGEYKKIILKA